MKTALVTGANGFIGRTLCAYLQDKGVHVIAAARDMAGIAQGLTPLYIPDICSPGIWKGRLESVDVIYHLAGCAHAVKDGHYDAGLRAEDYLYRVNVEATRKLALSAEAAGVKRLVYISSIKAVGESSEQGLFHEKSPLTPQDNYGRSKREAENILWDIARNSSLEVTILRPPLVYGPGVKGNFLSLLRLCYSAWPLPLERLQNKRSMVHVSNLAEALYHCGHRRNAAGEIFHLKDEDELPLSILLRNLRTFMALSPRLFPFPLTMLSWAAQLLGYKEAWERLSTPLQVDDRKIRTLLKWKPAISLEEGLKMTVEWYLALQDAQNSHKEEKLWHM